MNESNNQNLQVNKCTFEINEKKEINITEIRKMVQDSFVNCPQSYKLQYFNDDLQDFTEIKPGQLYIKYQDSDSLKFRVQPSLNDASNNNNSKEQAHEIGKISSIQTEFLFPKHPDKTKKEEVNNQDQQSSQDSENYMDRDQEDEEQDFMDDEETNNNNQKDLPHQPQQYAENQASLPVLNVPQKKLPKHRERTIRKIIEKVILWRQIKQGNGCKFAEAANSIGVNKKSLDDYYRIIRVGVQLGFDFKKHKFDKIGVLRQYTKANKAKIVSKKLDNVNLVEYLNEKGFFDDDGDQKEHQEKLFKVNYTPQEIQKAYIQNQYILDNNSHTNQESLGKLKISDKTKGFVENYQNFNNLESKTTPNSNNFNEQRIQQLLSNLQNLTEKNSQFGGLDKNNSIDTQATLQFLSQNYNLRQQRPIQIQNEADSLNQDKNFPLTQEIEQKLIIANQIQNYFSDQEKQIRTKKFQLLFKLMQQQQQNMYLIEQLLDDLTK